MGTIYGRKIKTEILNFHQNIDCPECNRAGSWKAKYFYKQFTVNFIPLFKYSKKYYIESTCCGTKYEISPELGKQIADGKKKSLTLDEIKNQF